MLLSAFSVYYAHNIGQCLLLATTCNRWGVVNIFRKMVAILQGRGWVRKCCVELTDTGGYGPSCRN